MKKIRIHPHFDFNWCSYFLQGLLDVYGYDSIEFSTNGFPSEVHEKNFSSASCLLLVILLKENKKICLDPRDELGIPQNIYKWADLYAKTNLPDNYLTSYKREKLKPLAPFFPITLNIGYQCVEMAIKTFKYNLNDPLGHLKKFFYRSYFWRSDWRSYCVDEPVSTSDYVAYAVSYRKKDETSNLLRSYFMRACIECKINLEGGFFFRSDIIIPKDVEKYFMKTNKAYRYKEYVGKTKRSSMGFICPAVKNNHSWRLGEYLALGKAIIVTEDIKPITVPLTHGINAHFTKPDFLSIKAAVQRLKEDVPYRRNLEVGAREYFLKFATPKKIIENIFTDEVFL